MPKEPRKVKDEEALWRKQRAKSAYGWEKIAEDGGTFELRRGEHFTASMESARVQAHGWSKRHGFKAQTHVDGDSIYVKFYKPGQEPE